MMCPHLRWHWPTKARDSQRLVRTAVHWVTWREAVLPDLAPAVVQRRHATCRCRLSDGAALVRREPLAYQVCQVAEERLSNPKTWRPVETEPRRLSRLPAIETPADHDR